MQLRTLLILAFLLSASFIVHAVPQPELGVPELILAGHNCNPDGGPEAYNVRVLVNNPHSAPLSVNYSYYDFKSQGMVAGGRACVVLPLESAYCTVEIPVRLGGTGNGSSLLQLKVSANYLDEPEVTSKKFNLTIMHMSTTPESNIGAIIGSAESSLSGKALLFSSACEGQACCGMVNEKQELQTASTLLVSARGRLAACEFSSALSDAYSASAVARHAESQYDSELPACNSALEVHASARANITVANSTLYRKAVCGANVSASREELSKAVDYYNEGLRLLGYDAYSGAETQFRQAITSARSSISLGGDCPPPNFEPPPVVQQATPIVTPTPIATPPPSDALSKVVGALGYIVIGAVIVVVIAALYVTFGKKWLDGGDGGARNEGFFGSPPPASPRSLEKTDEGVKVDHTKIDREFQEWLNQAEAEKHKRAKKGEN